MTPAEFADFFARQGKRTLGSETGWWYEYRPFTYTSLPLHRPISPSYEEVQRLLLHGRGIAARFPTNPRGPLPESGILLCSDRNYGLASLSRKARNQTRRGLENCTIEQVDFRFAARDGHELNIDTVLRQGGKPERPGSWRRFCEAAMQVRDCQAWVALVQGRTAGIVVLALVEDCLNIYHQSSKTDTLWAHPNNALTFTVTESGLADPRVSSVCYGQTSLNTGLDNYKLSMGFEPMPVGDCVVFTPLLRPFFMLGGQNLVHWYARMHPENQRWRRASLVLSHGAQGAGPRSESPSESRVVTRKS
jgi:hypothetical protein